MPLVKNVLRQREKAAHDELNNLIEDLKWFPINYNHYYTLTVQKARHQRFQKQLTSVGIQDHLRKDYCKHGGHCKKHDTEGAVNRLLSAVDEAYVADMDDFSCQDALDSLLAIYKVNRPIQPTEQPVADALAGPAKGLYCQRHHTGDRTADVARA